MAKLKIKVVQRAAKKALKNARRTSNGLRRDLARAIKSVKKSVKVYRKRVKDRDRGLKKRTKEISRFGRTQVVIGILAAEGSQAKKSNRRTTAKFTLAQVAACHEFGTKTIPRRSFIRGYYDEKRTGIEEAIRRMSVSVARGERTATEAHNLLGAAFVGGMQKRISEGIDPALADSTIRRKGSSVPLIDTGQLRSAITYKLRTKRG